MGDTKAQQLRDLRSIAEAQAGLELLVLFGSRGRDEERLDSDWDFAFLGGERLILATGFRNAVLHGYGDLDMKRVYEAASKGPDDLRAFLTALKKSV